MNFLAMLQAGSLPGAEAVLARARRVTLSAGEAAFVAGDRVAQVMVVERGLVRLAYVTAKGAEQTKSFCREGQVFSCLSSLEHGTPAPFSAVAMEETSLMVMPWSALKPLADTELAWSRLMAGVFRLMAARKEEREYELLCLAPEERYRRFLAREPDLASRLRQKDIAAYLGLTPVGLNRIVARVSKPA